MIENAPRTAVRTIWAPLILHDLLMSRRRAPRPVMYGIHWTERGEKSPSASRFRRFPAASHSLTHICKGAVFPLTSWSLCLPRHVLFHTFYFFIRPLKRSRAQGRVCSTGLHFYKQVSEASVLSVTESTLIRQILLLHLKSLGISAYAIVVFSSISHLVILNQN